MFSLGLRLQCQDGALALLTTGITTAFFQECQLLEILQGPQLPLKCLSPGPRDQFAELVPSLRPLLSQVMFHPLDSPLAETSAHSAPTCSGFFMCVCYPHFPKLQALQLEVSSLVQFQDTPWTLIPKDWHAARSSSRKVSNPDSSLDSRHKNRPSK